MAKKRKRKSSSSKKGYGGKAGQDMEKTMNSFLPSDTEKAYRNPKLHW